MILPPEIRGDGKHLCQVCHETAVLHVSPLPGQNIDENIKPYEQGLDLCPLHSAQMTLGALVSIGRYEEAVNLMSQICEELIEKGFKP